jgi:putative transposase
VSERYELIDVEKDTLVPTGHKKYTVVTMCEWLDVSNSGYYEWREHPPSVTARRRAYLAVLIGTSFADSDETYGHRRVHAERARWGARCGIELVRSIMRALGLVAGRPRPWRHSLTDADPGAPAIPDLVTRDVTAEAPGVKMVGAITDLPTWAGWLYVATVIDCHTKEVIGWAMADNYKTPLISAAIRMAARNHRIVPGAIFHSDRGSNYTSAEFAETLTDLDVRSPSAGQVSATITRWPNRSSPR